MRQIIYKDITIAVADSFFTRLFGLLPEKSADRERGLLIKPCKQVHTFGMKFAIDVLYLKNGSVIDFERELKPWRVGRHVKSADSVLELAAGTMARLNIQIGDNISGN